MTSPTTTSPTTGAAPPAPALRAELWLDPALPLAEGLTTAFAQVIAYAASWAARAAEEPTTAVHEYRKSVRRARALVRLVRPLLKARRYEALDAALRCAVLETSALRDADVLGETARELPRSPLLTSATARLRAVLALRAAQGATTAQVADVLRRGAQALALLPPRFERAVPSRTSWDELVRALRAGYRRCRRTFELAAAPDRTDEEIHDWRKRVKELRYQLEMLEPASAARAEMRGRRPPIAREAALGKLAKALGQITDLMVLREAVRHEAQAIEELGPGRGSREGSTAVEAPGATRLADEVPSSAVAKSQAIGPGAAELLVDVLGRMIPARFALVAGLGERFFLARPGVFSRALLGVPREDDPPLPELDDAGVEPPPSVEVPRSRPAPRYPHAFAPARPPAGKAPLCVPSRVAALPARLAPRLPAPRGL